MTRVLFFNSINMTPGKVMMIGLFRCFANLTPGDGIKILMVEYLGVRYKGLYVYLREVFNTTHVTWGNGIKVHMFKRKEGV